MLYTTYLGNLNKVPDDSVKILIMGYKPINFDLLKYGIEWKPILAPRFLSAIKNGTMTKAEAFLDYEEQLCTPLIKKEIDKIISLLREGKDVFLICCEKQLCDCHRRLLAEYIRKLSNIEWKEYNRGE